MSHTDAKSYHDLSPPSSLGQTCKLPTQNDDSSSSEKREKACERQCRKRERGRSTDAMTLYPQAISDANPEPLDQESGDKTSMHARRKLTGKQICLDDLLPEEAQRKQRIREAARERQRKHRANVKAKKMAELGMAIVNEGGRIEQTAIGYTVNEHGQYEAVLADPNLQHHPMPPSLPVPHPHATRGQMFASTILLSLSCTPHLKQQLLRTLRSTNEDLASIEPFIAASFDQWDHSRTLHYAAQGHHVAHALLPTQTSAYAQPYALFNDNVQRPLVAPARPPPGRDQSPPKSGNDSDTQTELEPSHPPSTLTHDTMPIIPVMCTDGMQDDCDRGRGETKIDERDAENVDDMR